MGEFLNHWWNLPFLVMLGLVGVFFVLQAVGIASHGGDADTDVDHDVDTDADHDAEADTDADADHDADANDGVSMHEVLSFFGVGRVPLMVVWVTLFLFTGLTGIFFNSWIFVHAGGVYPAWGLGAAGGSSLAIGLVAVRLFSRVAAKFVDVGGKGSSTKHDLAGKIGVVASATLDKKFGEVRVKDDRGNEILIHARLSSRKSDEEPDLVRGDEVILVEYDAGSELFTATASARAFVRVAGDDGEAREAESARTTDATKGDRR